MPPDSPSGIELAVRGSPWMQVMRIHCGVGWGDGHAPLLCACPQGYCRTEAAVSLRGREGVRETMEGRGCSRGYTRCSTARRNRM